MLSGGVETSIVLFCDVKSCPVASCLVKLGAVQNPTLDQFLRQEQIVKYSQVKVQFRQVK